MANKNARIAELLLASGAAVLPVDGSSTYGAGLSSNVKLFIKDFEAQTNERFNQVYKYMQEVGIECDWEQLAEADFKALINFCKASDVTVAAVTSGVSKSTDFSASGGIFIFENANSLGIEMDLQFSRNKRAAALKLGRAFDVTTMQSLITAAATNTVPGELSIPSLDRTKLVSGGMNGLLLGSGATIGAERVADWLITLKTKAVKDQQGRAIVSGFEVEIMTKYSGVDPAELAALLATQGLSSDVTIAVPTGTPFNIVFKKEALLSESEFDNDDQKREGTLKFRGFYPIDFVDTTVSGAITFKAML